MTHRQLTNLRVIASLIYCLCKFATLSGATVNLSDHERLMTILTAEEDESGHALMPELGHVREMALPHLHEWLVEATAVLTSWAQRLLTAADVRASAVGARP